MATPLNSPCDFQSKFNFQPDLEMTQRDGDNNLDLIFKPVNILRQIRQRIEFALRKYKCFKFKQEKMLNLPIVKNLPNLKMLTIEHQEAEVRV